MNNNINNLNISDKSKNSSKIDLLKPDSQEMKALLNVFENDSK